MDARVKPLADSGLEWGVVLACCTDPSVVGHVLNRVRPDDLSDAAASAALAVVESTTARGDVADPVLVARELRRAGHTDAAVDLLSHRHELGIAGAAPGHATHLRSLAMLRRVRRLGTDLHELSELDDPSEVIARAQALLRDAGAELPRAEMTLAELVDETLRGLEDDARLGAVPTHLAGLDRALGGGMMPGRLYVLGARTSVGKSAIAGNWARLALDVGNPVLFVSLEMTGREVITRLVTDRTGLVGRPGSAEHTGGLIAALGEDVVQGWPLHFVGAATSIAQVMTTARDLAARDLRLVVVDYLQLLPTPATLADETRATQLAGVSRSLKLLAQELHVPVLALSQLNRESTKRPDLRPRLADLRESGALEQDGDVVMLIHRDVDKASYTAEMIVAKNRHGPTGMVPLVFDPVRLRFREATKEAA